MTLKQEKREKRNEEDVLACAAVGGRRRVLGFSQGVQV
jgi:hypothetical protein